MSNVEILDIFLAQRLFGKLFRFDNGKNSSGLFIWAGRAAPWRFTEITRAKKRQLG